MTGARERPWWSSGEEPGDGGSPSSARSAYGSGSDGPDRARATWDAAEEFVRFARRAADGHRFDSETCGVCPLCALIRSVGEVRPELVAHLSEAARHLTLAAKAIVDAQAAAYPSDDLQRIDVEDAP